MKKRGDSKNPQKHQAIVQKWEGRERDQPTSPDGYSLHVKKSDLVAYIKSCYKNLPRDYVPDFYTRTSGDHYVAEVDHETFIKIRRRWKARGLRVYNDNYPKPLSHN